MGWLVHRKKWESRRGSQLKEHEIKCEWISKDWIELAEKWEAIENGEEQVWDLCRGLETEIDRESVFNESELPPQEHWNGGREQPTVSWELLRKASISGNLQQKNGRVEEKHLQPEEWRSGIRRYSGVGGQVKGWEGEKIAFESTWSWKSRRRHWLSWSMGKNPRTDWEKKIRRSNPVAPWTRWRLILFEILPQIFSPTPLTTHKAHIK